MSTGPASSFLLWETTQGDAKFQHSLHAFIEGKDYVLNYHVRPTGAATMALGSRHTHAKDERYSSATALLGDIRQIVRFDDCPKKKAKPLVEKGWLYKAARREGASGGSVA